MGMDVQVIGEDGERVDVGIPGDRRQGWMFFWAEYSGKLGEWEGYGSELTPLPSWVDGPVKRPVDVDDFANKLLNVVFDDDEEDSNDVKFDREAYMVLVEWFKKENPRYWLYYCY